MGGYGSGAPRRWASIEGTQSIVLDVNRLQRLKLIQPDARVRATLRSPDGDPLDLVVSAATWGGQGEMLLRGKVTTWEHGTFDIDQRVDLVSTVPTFGGRRYWFLCPRTGRRCARLYLPNGVRRFASRHGYGLVHRSRQECTADRLNRRARKVRFKLGGEASNVADLPKKPKRMRWATYEDAIGRINAWEADADTLAFRALVSRVTTWIPGQQG